MKLSHMLLLGFAQSALTQILIIVYNLFAVDSMTDIFVYIGSFTVLLLLVTIFNALFTLLLRKRNWVLRLFVVPLLTSLLTTFTIIMYPEIGFTSLEWYVLFALLTFAGLIAHFLLYDASVKTHQPGGDGL